MNKQEIMSTRFGEMSDMISCFAIYNGAEPKTKQRKMDFDKALELR